MTHCPDCFSIMIKDGDGWVCDPPDNEHWQFYICPKCGKSGRQIM